MFGKAKKTGAVRAPFRIGLGAVNNAAIFLAAFVAAALLYAMMQSIESYHSLVTATEQYVACQQNASEFLSAADLLTSECRYFALTGDLSHARIYAEELQTARRREHVIDNLSEWLSGEAAFNYLKQSLIYSNTLSLDERYAMRLMADVYGIAPDALPETVAAVPLDAQDAALSDADKRALAMETLFGERAGYLKQQTEQSTRRSVDTLVEATRARQAKASSDMRALLNGQRLLTILLVALLLVVVLLTWRLIIHPMREGVRRIRAHETLPLSGSSEMVFLANAYNEMFAQHERDARELTYSATHDALTGLCNLTAFDRLRNGLDTADACVILVDIDHFKDFNDNYGHAVGDKVLKRVARVLTQCFRTDDFVARIGGDEFCVILRRVGSEMREQVAEKVERINAMLGRQEEGLPARRRSSASG